MQLQEAINDYLLDLEDHGNSNLIIASYRSDLQQFMAFLQANQGPTTVEEIRPVWVRSFLRERRRQGLATSSVARKLNCLRSFFKFGVLQEWLKRNLALPVEAPKVAETLPTYLKEDKVYRLINAVNLAKHCFAKRDRALIKLLLTTGRSASCLQVTATLAFCSAKVPLFPGAGDGIAAKGHDYALIF